jgi:hypothetical protein
MIRKNIPELMEKELPKFLFRKTRGNRHTLPRLLGILEGEGLNRDFDVRLGDSIEEMIRLTGKDRTIIGFSFMTLHLMDVKAEVARLRKCLGEKTLIIAGGPHATADPQGSLNLGFDYVFAGEADQTFPLFLRQYLCGKMPETSVITGERGICPLGTHPPFSIEHRFFAPIEITRGCLYNCHFCQAPPDLRTPSSASPSIRLCRSAQERNPQRIPADHFHFPKRLFLRGGKLEGTEFEGHRRASDRL